MLGCRCDADADAIFRDNALRHSSRFVEVYEGNC